MLFSAILVISCAEEAKTYKQVVVKNTMDTAREFETVSVNIASLDLDNTNGGIVLRDAATQAEVVSQEIDSDGDGKMDAILFQPEIGPNTEKIYDVAVTDQKKEKDSLPACYSRFVPERTDDYAWENNRVAFRTYGPTAQKMKEDGVPGGTLSSGIDAWLKRVDYPIIDKWYKKELETDGSYHEDTGEGLDNFHVGISRGVGGIAKKVDTTYHISKNFVSWKTLTNGPVRTSFVLTYAEWDAAGNVLITRRAADSHQGGLWEFPGGKVEPGESLQVALALGLLQRAVPIHPISSAEFPTPAPRPAWSVLSKDRIRDALGLRVPTWQDGLDRHLRRLAPQE